METPKVVKRGRKPRQASVDDGRNGENPVGAIEGADAGEQSQGPVAGLTVDLVTAKKAGPVVTWEQLSEHVAKVESDNPDRRIVRVWHTNGPEIWKGRFGNATVAHGAPAYQWNTGEITNL